MTQLQLYLFGTPRFIQDAIEVSFRRRKALALIAFLAMKKQPQNRDKLCAMFWSDFDTDRARNNLRRELSLLNSTFDRAILGADRTQIWLDSETDLWLDVSDYWAKVRTVNSRSHELNPSNIIVLEEAVTLYQDDFMAGFGLSDSPQFDEWQYFETENLRRSLASNLRLLIRACTEQQDYERAIDYSHRWLAIDPLHEPAQRQLMQLLAWSGQFSSALHQYEICVDLLEQELGVSPDDQTCSLYEAIRNRKISHPAINEDQQPIAKTPHNLPAQVTPFIGRQREIKALGQLLSDNQTRLTTILGPGGMGKTRLAIETASHYIGNFEQGVYMVDLAPLSDSERIVHAIADGVGFDIQSDDRDPKQQVLDYLQPKKMLLIVDNCEHLLSGIDILSDILSHASDIEIIATSREKLNLLGETILNLDGLDFKRANDITNSDAGILFIHTAQRVRPSFILQSNEVDALFQICNITYGMPLAIMLSATWTATLTPSEILEEMQNSLTFLETDMRDIPQRHRSIQAVMDSTWACLSQDEQQILMTCSVFRGGFTREALQQIIGATLRQQASLTNKALLNRDPDTGRYRIHELLRQYAQKHLEASDYQHDSHDKHAMYYLTWLSNLEGDIKGRRQVEALNEFEADFENIRLAWEWGIATQNYSAVDLALHSVYHFFEIRTRQQEGEEWMTDAYNGLESFVDPNDQLIRYRIDLRRLKFSFQLNHQPEDIVERLDKYLAIMQSEQNHSELGHCWNLISFRHERMDGRIQDVLDTTKKSLSHFRKSGDSYFIGDILHSLGHTLCDLGQVEEGMADLQEAIRLSREIGNLNIVLWSLVHLGHYTLYKNLAQIEKYLAEAIDISNQLDSQWGRDIAYCRLARVRFFAGDFSGAERVATEGLDEMESEFIGFKVEFLEILSKIKSVAHNDYEKAIQLA